MIKLLISLFFLLKEIFIDKKEDLDILSLNFRFKKIIRLVLFIVLSIFSIVIFDRFIYLFDKYDKLQKEFIDYIEINKNISNNKEVIVKLCQQRLIYELYCLKK